MALTVKVEVRLIRVYRGKETEKVLVREYRAGKEREALAFAEQHGPDHWTCAATLAEEAGDSGIVFWYEHGHCYPYTLRAYRKAVGMT